MRDEYLMGAEFLSFETAVKAAFYERERKYNFPDGAWNIALIRIAQEENQ